MRKTAAIILLFAMLLSTVACGTPAPDSNTPPGGQTSENQENEESGTGSEQKPEKPEPKEFDKTAVISETVLWDKNNIKITATELTYGYYSAELSLLIENNSDENLSFIANSIGYSRNSINGYMVSDGYLNCEVAAGKKAMDSIEFGYTDLMLYGIYTIADIEIGFDIQNEQYKHIYTGSQQIKTTAADTYDYETPHYRNTIAEKNMQVQYGYTVPYFSDVVCYAEKGLTVASCALIVNEDSEELLLMEVINESDKMVAVCSKNIRFNGLLVESSTWSYDAISPGNTGIISINLDSILEAEFRTAYGINEIGEISLELTFEDEDSNIAAPSTTIKLEVPKRDSSLDMEGVKAYNANGIQIISKGIYADPATYSDDLHLLLMVQNSTGKTIKIDDISNSLSVNDFMVSYLFLIQTIPHDSWAALDVELMDYDLESLNISSPTDIEALDFRISIKNENYKELDTVDIQLTFSTKAE